MQLALRFNLLEEDPRDDDTVRTGLSLTSGDEDKEKTFIGLTMNEDDIESLEAVLGNLKEMSTHYLLLVPALLRQLKLHAPHLLTIVKSAMKDPQHRAELIEYLKVRLGFTQGPTGV